MSDLFQLWGSITRVDTVLGAEMTAEFETGYYDVGSYRGLLFRYSLDAATLSSDGIY
jgi:hypothetical protein